MKRAVLLAIWCIAFSSVTFSHPVEEPLTPVQVQNLGRFIKVWGFLKYYHSAVADGKFDWDQVFLDNYVGLRKSTSLSEGDSILYALYTLCESKKDKWADVPSVEEYDSTAIVIRPNWQWLRDSTILNKKLSTALLSVKDNFRPLVNKYTLVGFWHYLNATNDNKLSEFKDEPYPSEAIRCLAFSRYWNIVEYFYPQKQGIDGSWDSVLFSHLPHFINATTARDYVLAFLQLQKPLNDAGAGIQNDTLSEFLGKGYLPFQLTTVNSQTIITGSYGSNTEKWKAKMAELGIGLGDQLLEINGRSVQELKEQHAHYISASNEHNLEYFINEDLLRGKLGDSVDVTVTQGDGRHTIKTIYQDELLPEETRSRSFKEGVGLIMDSIGYFDLGKAQRNSILTALKSFSSTKAIIFDLRHKYLNTAPIIMNFLSKQVDTWYSLHPVVSRPGCFFSTYKQKQQFGSNLTSPVQYKGKYIILVSENTDANAEYAAMVLQTLPGAITIGNQTAGDFNAQMEIALPGGIHAFVSAVSVFYPDDTPTYPDGIKIDIHSNPTIQGIREGRDEVLEHAVRYILNH